MLKADLHIHSTTSDGSDSPEEIVRHAESKGLGAIAFTEHDTLAHLSRLPKSGKVQVLGGIEISAVDPRKGTRAHILGYCIQEPTVVEALVRPLVEARNRNSEKQVAVLRQHGYAIDESKLQRADGKHLYKQHIMDYLVKTGQAPDMFDSFYRSTFKQGGVCDFDISYINVHQAVETIVRAGGQAVLAHSGQQQNFYLIPRLVKCGLVGLELDHPANTPEDRMRIRRYAQAYGLFLTGGSDYHGRFEVQQTAVGDYLAEESGVCAVCLNR